MECLLRLVGVDRGGGKLTPAKRHSDRGFCLTAKIDEAPIAIGAFQANVRCLISDTLQPFGSLQTCLFFCLDTKETKSQGLQNAPANILSITKFGRVISD
jgi:hypothetical protein